MQKYTFFQLHNQLLNKIFFILFFLLFLWLQKEPIYAKSNHNLLLFNILKYTSHINCKHISKNIS